MVILPYHSQLLCIQSFYHQSFSFTQKLGVKENLKDENNVGNASISECSHLFKNDIFSLFLSQISGTFCANVRLTVSLHIRTNFPDQYIKFLFLTRIKIIDQQPFLI